MRKLFLCILWTFFCACNMEEHGKLVTKDNRYILEVKPFNNKNNTNDSIIAYNLHIITQTRKGLMEDTLKVRGVDKRKYYFSYNFGKDIFLEQDNKQYMPVSYHFEAGSGISNKYNFFLFFKLPEGTNNSNKKLIIKSELLSKEVLVINLHQK